MNPVTLGNIYALLFLIMGAVWGILLLQLGIPKTEVVEITGMFIFGGVAMAVVGIVLEAYQKYKDDSEDSE